MPEKPRFKQVQVNWVYPNDLTSHFVTNMLVQHADDYFILSFFEAWPPAILGSPEERDKQLEAINEIEAKCVARIVVTPEKMKTFLQVIQDNMEKFHLAKLDFGFLDEKEDAND